MSLICKLHCYSSTDHLSQLYTGFGMLNELGAIKTVLVKDDAYKPTGKQCLMVTLNDSIRIFYDLLDGANLYEEFVDRCDFYFKRSFDPKLHKKNILPLGLNYQVTVKSDYSVTRFFWNLRCATGVKDILLSARNQAWLRNRNRIDAFEGYPRYETEPKIIFLVRLWDPEITDNAAEKDERDYINSVRIECIKKLTTEFRSNFIGGVYPNGIALKQCPSLVINQAIYEKANYLRMMRDSSICIATMGLHKSIGFKMAEYVAGAKAIVSEKLHYQSTGDFEKGRNYLEFESADQCVEKASELFNDPLKCYDMAQKNYEYYHRYLRPDILIWNTLTMAMIQHKIKAPLYIGNNVPIVRPIS